MSTMDTIKNVNFFSLLAQWCDPPHLNYPKQLELFPQFLRAHS
jgi:hypothetical protein